MSADKDNEYFSDGISEEIFNALVKVADLKVAGRTSSFYFKGKNESLITIGETLGVANVLGRFSAQAGREGTHHRAINSYQRRLSFVVRNLRW